MVLDYFAAAGDDADAVLSDSYRQIETSYLRPNVDDSFAVAYYFYVVGDDDGRFEAYLFAVAVAVQDIFRACREGQAAEMDSAQCQAVTKGKYQIHFKN